MPALPYSFFVHHRRWARPRHGCPTIRVPLVIGPKCVPLWLDRRLSRQGQVSNRASAPGSFALDLQQGGGCDRSRTLEKQQGLCTVFAKTVHLN